MKTISIDAHLQVTKFLKDSDQADEIEGQSIAYKCTFNKYHANDPVDIKYFIAKNGRARIMVNDSTLEPYSDDMAAIARNTKIASINSFDVFRMC